MNFEGRTGVYPGTNINIESGSFYRIHRYTAVGSPQIFAARKTISCFEIQTF